MLLPLRLKMGILQPLRPKSGMLQPLRLKMGMLRLSATKTRYVANLRDPKMVCCEPCDSNWVGCDFILQFAQVKYRMLQFWANKVICANLVCKLGLKFAINVSTESAKKWYASADSTQARYVLTDSTQAVCLSFDYVRSRMNISTKFDRTKAF